MAVETPKQIFDNEFPAKIQAKPELLKQINAIYEFELSGPNGGTWTLDLTEASGGKVTEGSTGNAKCVIKTSDQTLVDIVNKKTQTQMAFMSGKLKVNDVNSALKLTKFLG